MRKQELYLLLEDEQLSPEHEEIINDLLQALTDWPDDVESLADYAEQVKKVIKSERVDYDSINQALQHLNPATHAWALESLTSLLKVFSRYKSIEMNGMLKMISNT